MSDGAYPCPVSGCEETRVVPSLIRMHVRKDHPEAAVRVGRERHPNADQGNEGGEGC